MKNFQIITKVFLIVRRGRSYHGHGSVIIRSVLTEQDVELNSPGLIQWLTEVQKGNLLYQGPPNTSYFSTLAQKPELHRFCFQRSVISTCWMDKFLLKTFFHEIVFETRFTLFKEITNLQYFSKTNRAFQVLWSFSYDTNTHTSQKLWNWDCR